MKRLMMVMILASALGMVVAPAAAQETREAPEKPRKKKPARPVATQPLLRGAHAQMARICDLSEEQQKKIAELNAKTKEAMKAFRAENGEKMKEIRERVTKARESQDKEAARSATAEMRALYTKQNEIISKGQADIMAVLTAEQKAAWDEYTAINALKGWFKAAKLTDEQLAQVKAEYVKLVFCVVDGKAHPHLVETGINDVTRVEISQGIELADEVVIGPYRSLDQLKEGSMVKLKEEPTLAGADESPEAAEQSADADEKPAATSRPSAAGADEPDQGE